MTQAVLSYESGTVLGGCRGRSMNYGGEVDSFTSSFLAGVACHSADLPQEGRKVLIWASHFCKSCQRTSKPMINGERMMHVTAISLQKLANELHMKRTDRRVKCGQSQHSFVSCYTLKMSGIYLRTLWNLKK